MELSLYRLSLAFAIPLLLFFGFHMLLARVPEKKHISNFLLSRRLMGAALLLLATNYSVHFLFMIRAKDVIATILFNMVTYFLCYWLFSAAMMVLLDSAYINRKRFTVNLGIWLIFCCSSMLVAFLPLGQMLRRYATFVLAALLLVYGVFLSVRVLWTYSSSIKRFNDSYSDDIGSYIRWMSIFTYWALAFGVGCSLLTFLPDKYVFLWVLSAIPLYIYLYCCYQNYVFFHEDVEMAILDEQPETVEELPEYHSDISARIDQWIAEGGYRTSGITLNDLAAQLFTNRTYLSEYINCVYNKNFRDWISDLRIEYAKRLMKEQPQLKVQEISESSGFLSTSHFSRTFSAREGCSPARWRQTNTD